MQASRTQEAKPEDLLGSSGLASLRPDGTRNTIYKGNLVPKGDPDGHRVRICQHLHALDDDLQPLSCGRSRRLGVPGRVALPRTLWAEIASQVIEGESLRSLAERHGVSRECIRRIVLTHREAMTAIGAA